MSESSQRRFLSEKQKIQCTKCNKTFDSDHEKRHMERNHPLLVKEGKTPSTIPVVDKSQSNLLSFFHAAPPKKDQALCFNEYEKLCLSAIHVEIASYMLVICVGLKLPSVLN